MKNELKLNDRVVAISDDRFKGLTGTVDYINERLVSVKLDNPFPPQYHSYFGYPQLVEYLPFLYYELELIK